MTPTIATGFSGIGGGDLAARNAGFETIWQSEFDPTPKKSGRPTPMHRQWPVRILHRHFPEVHNYGDIASVRRPPAPDVFVFGSPCQDLSVAGQRAGLTGARSKLFFEACRVINECRPALAIWENVPGAFSSNTGRDFFAVVDALAELGARQLAWRVFDSQYAGVPQQRRRIYLVADFAGERAGEILFERDRCDGHPAAGREAGEGLARTLRGRASSPGVSEPGRGGEDDSNLIVLQRETSFALQASGGHSLDPTRESYIAGVVTQRLGAHTGNSNPIPQNYVVRTAQTSSNGHGISEDLAYTLDGTDGPAQRLPVGVRRLTPIECERLQGFPDGWTCLCGAEADLWSCTCPDGPRYKGLGNAMTRQVIEWILQRAKEAL